MTRAALTFVIALSACDLDYSPDVGPLRAPEPIPADAMESTVDAVDATVMATGRCEDSNPSTAVSYAASIRPLLTKSSGGCVFCHGTMSTSGFNMSSYESLRRGGNISGTSIVVDGRPCESIIFQKLGPAPPFGSRMPYNGPPYFTSAELGLLRDWIAEGAHNN